MFKFCIYFKKGTNIHEYVTIYANDWKPSTNGAVIIFERDGEDIAWFMFDAVAGIQRKNLTELEKTAIEKGRLDNGLYDS